MITIIDINEEIKKDFELAKAITELKNNYSANVALLDEKEMKAGFLAQQDLMMLSLESWKNLVDSQSIWLTNVPSTLIIKP